MSTEHTIAGVYVGKKIAPGLFAEEVASRRFVIRQQSDAGHANRVGEVCGGTRTDGTSLFQAMTMKGDLKGSASTMLGAARVLAYGGGASMPPVPAMAARRKPRIGQPAMA